jgi:hypothetical protein
LIDTSTFVLGALYAVIIGAAGGFVLGLIFCSEKRK